MHAEALGTQCFYGARTLRFVTRTDHDLGARLGQCPRECEAKAPVAARDEHFLADE